MKKIILISLLSIICFSMMAYSQKDTVIDYKQLDAPLPTIALKDRMGTVYSEKHTIQDRNFILVLFNPTCGHCIDAAQLIKDNIALFDSNTVYFMSAPDMMEYLDGFAVSSHFQENKTIYLGIDTIGMVNEVYNYNNLPQINIYDKDRKLIKVMNGDLKLKELKKYLY